MSELQIRVLLEVSYTSLKILNYQSSKTADENHKGSVCVPRVKAVELHEQFAPARAPSVFILLSATFV